MVGKHCYMVTTVYFTDLCKLNLIKIWKSGLVLGSSLFLLLCVSGIVTQVASLPVFSDKSIELKNICFIIKSCCHVLLSFHNTYLVWTNQCNYDKNACINRLWQHDFWMKPKNFVVDIITGKHQWRPQSLTHPVLPQLPQLTQKLTLGMKMVKNDSITIISLLDLYSRYVYIVN